jgi:S-(hydroxymethyl)glutathione dehydrogenase/alcohol dehydrogenase
MKAAVLTQINCPLEIKDVELTALKVGQVKVRILVSGLCGAQLQEIAGLKGNEKFLPHLLGHEGCGIVEAVGDGVTRVKVGDKVVMHWRVGAGIESPFPSYILNGKTISSGKVTTLSEYSIVSENRLTTVPPDTDEYLCALLGCGLTTALGTINNEIDLKFGESIMIIGCGGVGLNLLQGARMASAFPVIGVDLSQEKREIAISAGATHFITADQLADEMKNQKVDVVVDTTGNADAISHAFAFLSDKGRCVLVGQPKPGQSVNIPNANSLFGGNGKTLKATQGGKTSPNEDIARYVRLNKAGLLNIRSIVTHEYSLADINTAVEVLRSGKAGRIMVRMV